jgi:hypothetical protein
MSFYRWDSRVSFGCQEMPEKVAKNDKIDLLADD